jgi:hypothetical protein
VIRLRVIKNATSRLSIQIAGNYFLLLAANGVNAQDEFLGQSTLFVICYDHFLSCCSVCCRSSCVASGARVAPYCVRAGRYTMWRPSPFAERYYVETITLRRARLYGDRHSAQSSTVENVEILTGGRAPLCGDPRRTQSCTMWETLSLRRALPYGDPRFARGGTVCTGPTVH